MSMHEWALASAIINTVRKRGIKEAVVLVGELQTIDTDIFNEAINQILASEPDLNLKLDIKVEEAEFKCRVCGWTWKLSQVRDKLSSDELESIHFIPELVYAYIRCPNCKSVDYEVIRGRGISLAVPEPQISSNI